MRRRRVAKYGYDGTSCESPLRSISRRSSHGRPPDQTKQCRFEYDARANGRGMKAPACAPKGNALAAHANSAASGSKWPRITLFPGFIFLCRGALGRRAFGGVTQLLFHDRRDTVAEI